VVIWLFVELVVVGISCLCQLSFAVSLLLAGALSLRILEVLQVTVNATLFDPDDVVSSSARMLVLAAFNFVELILCFGVVYATNYQMLMGAGRPVTGFYLSVITQLTIGYGDVYRPAGFAWWQLSKVSLEHFLLS
jgi:hypothetical protein